MLVSKSLMNFILQPWQFLFVVAAPLTKAAAAWRESESSRAETGRPVQSCRTGALAPIGRSTGPIPKHVKTRQIPAQNTNRCKWTTLGECVNQRILVSGCLNRGPKQDVYQAHCFGIILVVFTTIGIQTFHEQHPEHPMSFILKPWQLLFAILSGWIHHRQQQIIEFQNAEILSLM